MLQQIEDFIYKVPIILLFAVPVLLVLMLAVGPLYKRVRYNRVGLILIAAALGVSFYIIYVRFGSLL